MDPASSSQLQSHATSAPAAPEKPTRTKSSASTAPRTSGLNRTTANFLLDAALLVMFVTLAATTSIIRWIFPPPTESNGWTLWGWTLNEWTGFQFALLSVFTLGILVHLMLHWNWICGVVSTKYSHWKGRTVRIDEGSKTIWGVALLIVIVNVLGLLLAAASLTIQSPGPVP